MREFIDADFVANQVSFLRDSFRRTVLLVEGDDDARLLQRFSAGEDLCRVMPAYGKQNAIDALQTLRDRGLGSLTLVIVDADFWHLTAEAPSDPDIVVTDSHDLDMDVSLSDAFDALIASLCDADRLSAFENRCACSLRDHLLMQAAAVGRFRLVNHVDRLYLRFRDVDLAEFVTGSDVTVDVEAYVAQVVEGSEGDVAHITRRASEMVVPAHELRQLVRGHDFTALLSVALSGAVADCAEAIADQAHVEMMLRLAFGREQLERLNLYQSVADWEDRTGGLVFS